MKYSIVGYVFRTYNTTRFINKIPESIPNLDYWRIELKMKITEHDSPGPNYLIEITYFHCMISSVGTKTEVLRP